jgi:uncharacterized membrane protein|tara:strand:+ start:1088 stop:1324 length:237 start_codon:yes stop_codon:yes gene_type:complete
MKENSKTFVARKRHILKTITWRIIGTLDTMIIAWALSGDPLLGLSIGGIEVFSKMLLYYIHERAWYKSKFGIKRNKNV